MKRISNPVETTELCSYGCGNVAKFINGSNNLMCCKSSNSCPSNKKKNSTGVKNSGRDYVKTYKNISQESKDNMAWSRGKVLTDNAVIFTENSTYSNEMVKQRIVKNDLLEYKCVKCGINRWCGETIVLDLDHINGNNRDNRLTNLRYLCPNCHSQTDTFKGRNKNSGKIKISDQELLTAYAKCSNIRQALLEVGLAAKGGNYERMKQLIAPMVK